MYVNIILILFNVLTLYYLKSKIKSDNDYSKEKNYFIKKKVKNIFSFINIGCILLNSLYFILLLIFGLDINIIDLVIFILTIVSYIMFVSSVKLNKRLKLFDNNTLNLRDYLIIFSVYSLFCSTRLLQSNNINFIYGFLAFILFVLSSVVDLYFLIKNKEYACFSSKEDDMLIDIKFCSKLQLNKIFNCVIYITSFIVFVFVRIPYVFILYILIILLFMLIIFKKSKKIGNESKRLYNAVTISKENPNVIYAFQFTKDILLLKKIAIITIMLCISFGVLYGLGESAFCLVSLNMYMLLLYIFMEDKIYLIRYINSLNPSFINEKKYSGLVNKQISYIDTIKIFNMTFYRLIVNDNIIYKSNIILYDPELIIKDIDIKINKSNIDDYIMIENILYDE